MKLKTFEELNEGKKPLPYITAKEIIHSYISNTETRNKNIY